MTAAGDDGGPERRVAVVGGGVIGLTCALELARAGHRVQVLSADPVEATTSAVAAALWFPYRVSRRGRSSGTAPGCRCKVRWSGWPTRV